MLPRQPLSGQHDASLCTDLRCTAPRSGQHDASLCTDLRCPAPRSGPPMGQAFLPWHILNFLPEPHGQGPLRETPLSCSGDRVSSTVPTLRCSVPPVSLGAEYCSWDCRRGGCSRPLARKVGCWAATASASPADSVASSRPAGAASASSRRSSTSEPSSAGSAATGAPASAPDSPDPASISVTLIGCTCGCCWAGWSTSTCTLNR